MIAPKLLNLVCEQDSNVPFDLEQSSLVCRAFEKAINPFSSIGMRIALIVRSLELRGSSIKSFELFVRAPIYCCGKYRGLSRPENHAKTEDPLRMLGYDSREFGAWVSGSRLPDSDSD